MSVLRYMSASVDDTLDLATRLAPCLQAGDAILLDGKLGAGKTQFVQGIASALGYQEPATSPTFTIANFYECPRLTLLHIDAYRIESLAEFRDLGLSDYFDDACTVVEWGDKYAVEFEGPLTIKIAFSQREDENGRVFDLIGTGDRWNSVLSEMTRGHLKLVSP